MWPAPISTTLLKIQNIVVTHPEIVTCIMVIRVAYAITMMRMLGHTVQDTIGNMGILMRIVISISMRRADAHLSTVAIIFIDNT